MAENYDNQEVAAAHGNRRRAVAQGMRGIVCTGHPLTSIAGTRMLLNGGNAFDAAIASGFAAAVIEPTASFSLAAEVVGILYDAGRGELLTLSGQGGAPGGATEALFRERRLDKIPTGPGDQAHLAFTVPGAVDALLRLLATYGTKSVREVLEPAIDYCERGFPVYHHMHRFLSNPTIKAQFALYPPGGTSVFYPNGDPLPINSVLRQPQLGRTLRLLVKAEGKHSQTRVDGIQAARRTFYEGEISRRIVAFSERWGGLLQQTDLAGYQSTFETPLKTSFEGYEIFTQSTWSQAAVLLQALNMLEFVDLRTLGHNSPAYIHTVTEVLKLAFADRERFYGDPNFSPIPVDRLLAKDYAAARVKMVRHSASPASLAHGVIPATSGQTIQPTGGRAGRQDGTTHLAAIDSEGNMVALTVSGGALLKSAFMADLGCALSTRSEMFVLEENHPNGLQPGKRPRTTLSSYLVSRDGIPIMTFGCPGGDDQAQANLQMMLNVFVFGMDLQQAVEAPRFSTQSLVNSFYPRDYKLGELNLEHEIPQSVTEDLIARGHKVVRVDECGMGAVISKRDPETAVLLAGTDPRRHTYAIGW